MSKPKQQLFVPADVDSTFLKRYFRQEYGIPVRVESSRNHSAYIRVWIAPERHEPGDFRTPLRYSHRFPVDFRRLCLRVVYPDSPTLQGQTSGGNIESTSLAMLRAQWMQLFRSILPAAPEPTDAELGLTDCSVLTEGFEGPRVVIGLVPEG